MGHSTFGDWGWSDLGQVLQGVGTSVWAGVSWASVRGVGEWGGCMNRSDNLCIRLIDSK